MVMSPRQLMDSVIHFPTGPRASLAHHPECYTYSMIPFVH